MLDDKGRLRHRVQHKRANHKRRHRKDSQQQHRFGDAGHPSRFVPGNAAHLGRPVGIMHSSCQRKHEASLLFIEYRYIYIYIDTDFERGH